MPYIHHSNGILISSHAHTPASPHGQSMVQPAGAPAAGQTNNPTEAEENDSGNNAELT